MNIFPSYLISLICTLGLAAILAACAAAPLPPTQSLAAAENAIASAEQADARHYTGAKLEEARAQLELAEKSVAEGSMTRAEHLAHQSRAAAELAMVYKAVG